MSCLVVLDLAREAMDTNILRKRLSYILKKNSLTYTEVEKGSNIPRSSLRNFINGTVKEPKLDVILAVGKFLKIDISEFLPTNDSQSYQIESDSSPLDEDLFAECSTNLADYLKSKNIELTLSLALEVVRKVYEYSQKYSNSKLDIAFLQWCIDKKKY